MTSLIDKITFSNAENYRDQLKLVVSNLNSTANQCSGEIQEYLLELSSLFDVILKYVEDLIDQRKHLD